jgi:hypothetical protein
MYVTDLLWNAAHAHFLIDSIIIVTALSSIAENGIKGRKPT